MKSISIYMLALMAGLCHFPWAESKQEKGWALLQRTATNSLNSTDGSAAMTAVKQWRFVPTTCDGIPIRVENELQVNFTLSY